MYERQIEDIGLSKKQAAVYLALLELGHAGAPAVAKKAGLKRSTAYAILDELLTSGVVSSFKKGRLKKYRAQHPDTLLRQLEQRINRFENVLPDLEIMYATHHVRPKVEFFEGREGIKHIYDETLKCRSKKLYQICRTENFISYPGRAFAKQYVERRAKRGITAYGLHPNSDSFDSDTFGKESKRLKRRVRYLPPDMFHASMIMIFDNMVAMISTEKEDFGFIIESKELSRTMMAQFDFMWKMGATEPFSF